MKRYVLIFAFIIFWCVFSPFIAFKLLSGSFTPSNQNEASRAEAVPTDLHVDEKEKISMLDVLTRKKLKELDIQNYSPECQKALAVAIRSQIFFNDPTVSTSTEIDNEVLDCVAQTSGVVLTQDENVINAIVHVSSYKTTVSSPKGEKYLLSVNTYESPEDIKTTVVFTKDEFEKIILKICPTAVFEDVPLIKNIEFDMENRCKYISVGNCSVSASAFAEYVGLASLAFQISETSNTFTITSYGEGDGVGMSIKGADALSLQGETYDKILNAYYSDVVLKKINQS